MLIMMQTECRYEYGNEVRENRTRDTESKRGRENDDSTCVHSGVINPYLYSELAIYKRKTASNFSAG